MLRSLRAFLLAPLLGGCVSVATIETAVPPGTEVFEPRLVGTWDLMQDTSLGARMIITREGAAQYLIVDQEEHGKAAVFKGRLGPLGPRRWILELSPVGDTSKWFHPLSSNDSTRLNPPDYPLMLPVHMVFVVERADSGLRFAAFNGDTLAAEVTSGRLKTPFIVVKGDVSGTLLLTEREPSSLNAVLATFADRPHALIRLPRVGRRIALQFGR